MGLSLLCITATIMGCVKVEKMCGYTKYYCNPYYGKGACGPRITYRCDFLCNACAGNEPICKACWSCINTDGSLDYSQYRGYDPDYSLLNN